MNSRRPQPRTQDPPHQSKPFFPGEHFSSFPHPISCEAKSRVSVVERRWLPPAQTHSWTRGRLHYGHRALTRGPSPLPLLGRQWFQARRGKPSRSQAAATAPLPLSTQLLEQGCHTEKPVLSPALWSPNSEILPGERQASQQKALNLFPEELTSFAAGSSQEQWKL